MRQRCFARFGTAVVLGLAFVATPAWGQTETPPAGEPKDRGSLAATEEVRAVLGAELADAIAAAERVAVMHLAGPAPVEGEAIEGLAVRDTRTLDDKDAEQARRALLDPATCDRTLDPGAESEIAFTHALRFETEGAKPVTLLVGYPIGTGEGRLRWVEGDQLFSIRRGPLSAFLEVVVRG